MAYGPRVLEELTRQYTYLHDKTFSKGVNLWYGEAGSDFKVAEMILEGNNLSVVEQYLIDNYGEGDDD